MGKDNDNQIDTKRGSDTYTGQCSECGRPMTAATESTNGGKHTECDKD